MLANISTSSKVILLCLWFSAFASLYSDTWNSIALYIVLPFAFLLSFKNNGYKLKTNKYMELLAFLYLWCLLACIWATDMASAFRQMRQILGTYLICFIFAANAKNKRLLPWLYGTYIILMASAWWYAKTHIMIKGAELEEKFRLSDEKLNANTMAYYLFYVTIVLFMLGEMTQNEKIKRIWHYLFWLILPLSFNVALLTASRQVIWIQIPLISVLMYLRYLKGNKASKKVMFGLLVSISAVTVLPKIISEYDNSYLAVRNKMEIKEDSRSKLFLDAIKVGWDYFPIGVGPGNYIKHSYNKHFSHNTYSELWANVGIVGLWAYCYMLWLFLKRQWKRYNVFKNKEFLIFGLFGLIYLFDGVFYSFYNSVWLLGFFVLVVSHSEIYFQDIVKVFKDENSRCRD